MPRHSAETMEQKVDSLTERAPEIRDEYVNKARHFDQRIAELESKDIIKPHPELRKGYDIATREQRMTLCYSIAEKILDDQNIELNKSNMTKLEHVTDDNGRESPLSLYKPTEQRERDLHKPELFYVPVTHPKRTFSDLINRTPASGKEDTGEVLVVMRLNNSVKPSENTVLLFLTKPDKRGNIVLDPENMRFPSSMRSEKEFMDMQLPENGNSAEALAARGKCTREEYSILFEQQNGKTIQKHWEEHDIGIRGKENDDDYKDAVETRKEIYEHLEGVYAEYLRIVVDDEQEQLKELELLVNTIIGRNKKVVEGDDWKHLWDLLIEKDLKRSTLDYIFNNLLKATYLPKEGLLGLIDLNMEDITQGEIDMIKASIDRSYNLYATAN
jgi:hypothetical protein